MTAHPPSPHIPKTMQTGLMQWQNVLLVVGVVGMSMGLRYRRVQKPVPWLKSNLMRFVVALLSFALLSGAAAQQSHRYMGTDARVGVHPRYGWPIIPGISVFFQSRDFGMCNTAWGCPTL